jgi:hypothetical protein
MAKINDYDALTNQNNEITLTATKLAEMIGVQEYVSLEDVLTAKTLAKTNAVAKLVALGLTENEAKVIIG